MSYRLEVQFTEVKKDQILEYCLQLAMECLEYSEKIIRDNIHCAPSIVYRDTFMGTDISEKFLRMIDSNWLCQLFTVHFVYWPDKMLLGIIDNLFVTRKQRVNDIYFQNSSKCDYPYSVWKGIQYFEGIVNRIKKMDAGGIREILNTGPYEDYSIDEITMKLGYYRRTAVYEEITAKLELLKLVHEEQGSFEQFSIQTAKDKIPHLLMLLNQISGTGNYK